MIMETKRKNNLIHFINSYNWNIIIIINHQLLLLFFHWIFISIQSKSVPSSLVYPSPPPPFLLNNSISKQRMKLLLWIAEASSITGIVVWMIWTMCWCWWCWSCLRITCKQTWKMFHIKRFIRLLIQIFT